MLARRNFFNDFLSDPFDFGFFGTEHFEIVWETLCAHAFDNQRDMPIARCLPNAVLPERAQHLTTNSTMKDLIGRPTWSIYDGPIAFEQESAGKLNPDVVTIHYEKGACLAILDAKYYALSISGHTVANQPGVEDIVKQHAYQMALQDFARVNNLQMQNALLFPTGGRTRIAGSVHYDVLSDFANKKLIPIAVVFVNMSDIIDFYLTGSAPWKAIAQEILTQL